MSTPASPFQDHAQPILAGEPSITDDQRAQLWDVFHGSKDPQELAQKLAAQPAISDDLKHKLWTVKQAAAPAAKPVDKVAAAIQKVASMDTQTLDVAEAHPNVLKAFTTAATLSEKDADGTKPSADGQSAGKQPAGGKNTPLSQPPRQDGGQHLPPIPEGSHRVLHSNGGIYDVPAENIEKARALDPNMHVLNP